MKSKFLIFAVSLSVFVTGCQSTAEKEADLALVTNCDLNTYKNYQEIIAQNPEKLPTLTPQYKYYGGSSLLPFGSRESALNEAKLSVCKKNLNDALALVDKEKNYSAQERLIGGKYHIYRLMPFTFTDITEQALASQLLIWMPSYNIIFSADHREHLLNLAKDKKFSNLSGTIEKLIKEAESHQFIGFDPGYRTAMMEMQWEQHLKLQKELVDIYVLYNGLAAEKKLVAWAKYHEQKSIKLAAYQALVTLGKTTHVEELLIQETDADLKKRVGMLLI